MNSARLAISAPTSVSTPGTVNPFHQLGLQLSLELVDLHRKCRLAHSALLCCATNMPVSGERVRYSSWRSVSMAFGLSQPPAYDTPAHRRRISEIVIWMIRFVQCNRRWQKKVELSALLQYTESTQQPCRDPQEGGNAPQIVGCQERSKLFGIWDACEGSAALE